MLNQMNGKTYYIDPAAGDDANDGLLPSQPVQTYASRAFTGGDTVLFKCGNVIRDVLVTCNGIDTNPITYGAYGEGEKPVFMGSVPAGDPDRWHEELPSVWRYCGTFSSEVCNLIFNDGEFCGNLRWSLEDLQHPGEWFYTGIGKCSANEGGDSQNDILYLYSSANPGWAYRGIECALWGQRKMVAGHHHENIILENLSFRNSGVHAYQGIHDRKMIIRNCEFRFIGGAVWHREKRIRFGNAVEFWDGACDIHVESCLFDNIYDSGVTHQGGETRNIPERLYFRNNLFVDCGMSAYECREPSQEVYFEYNTCINAGGGFSMQGETPPRQSEIYPQPMGHHVFIWRIDPGTQPGHVTIRHNIFSEAPYGSAIYSVIDPVDERKFVIEYNAYWQTSGEMLMHVGGRSFLPSEFGLYQAVCGKDGRSLVADPLFRDAAHGDYRLQDASPCQGMGMKA